MQPKNYLVQNLKSKEKQKKKLEIFKEDESIFLSAIEDIKNLSWKDLIFKEKTDSNYDVYFPKTIDKKLKDSLRNFKKFDFELKSQLDKRYASFLEYYDETSEMYEINIYMEEFRNRTHFPDGVPNWALGLGLGIKVYRKLLNIAKFIQSSESASADVQKLYASLIQMNDVNVVLTKFRSLVIDGNVEKNEKAKIIGEFVLELYEDKVFIRKMKLNKDIVFDSTLMSQLGKEKLTKLLEEIKKLSKQEPTRLAFRKGKPEDDDSEDEECDPCPVCDGVGQWVDNRGRTQICGDCEGSGCREN